MAEITLPKYLQYINSLIDDSRLAEAVAHSRHLLEQHPRAIDAYRALGKALLEQGDYLGAIDIFQRVLSAAPDDFIAHVGLAIVHKAGDRWKQALWHMERAFEVEPYNPAIRSELQELYGRRDGLAPEQPELTRGGLARLYVNGGLYQQATLELRDLLAADPDRVELRLLLAEALWRAGDRVAAADVCREVLSLLPDCVQANAILADILLQASEPEAAEPYLQRVQDLTQVAAGSLETVAPFAQTFSLPGAISLPREVLVDRLSDEAALGMGERAEAAAWMEELNLEAAAVEDDLEWLRELQEEGEEFLPEPAEEEEEPEWLRDVPAEEPEEAAAGLVPPEKAAEAEPDWAESVAGEEIGWEARAAETGELPAWLAAEAQDPAFLEEPVETSTPDWLEEQPEETGEQSDLVERAETEPGAMEDEWAAAEAALGATASAMMEGAGEEPGEEELAAAEHETAVRDEQPEEAIPEGFAMQVPGDDIPEEGEDDAEAEALDWLQQLSDAAETPAAGVLPEWAEDDVAAGEVSELEWLEGDEEPLHDEEGTAETPQGEVSESWLEDELTGEDLGWLDQIAGGQADPPEEMPTLEWPEDAETLVEGPEREPALEFPAEEAEEAEEPAAAEGLDWLDALASEDADGDAAWLDELTAEETAEEGRPSEPRLFTDDITGIDWLEELETEPEAEAQAAARAESEDDAFDWLDEIDTGAPAEDEVAAWMAEGAADTGAVDEEGDETPFMWSEEEDAEAEPAAEPELAASTASETGEEDLAWLDAFDAEGEEEEPEEALADQFVAAEEEEPVLDWLEAEPPAGEAEAVEEPAEMPEEVAEEPVTSTGEAEAAEAPEAVAEEEEQEEALTWLDELPEEVAVETEEEVPHDLEEAMTWLDAQAGDEAGAAEAEEVPEDLEEAMAWLEQLAAQQGAPAEELPSLAEAGTETGAEVEEVAELPEPAEVEPEPEPNLEWMETLAAAGDEIVATSFDDDEFEVPEDIDEAMAWLEGLAAQQGAPLEELPSIQTDEDLLLTPFDDELAEEEEVEAAEDEVFLVEAGEAVIDVAEVPEDLEEAMTWLEELAAQQAAPAGEEPAAFEEALEAPAEPVEPEAEDILVEAPAVDVDETPESMTVPDVAMMYLESLVEGEGQFGDEARLVEEEEPADALAGEIPDDPEAALAWLEQLASGYELEIAAEAAQEAALEQVEEAAPEPEAVIDVEQEEAAPLAGEISVDVDEVPEDPDEVMAWLERLAARQGASLDELPTVDEYREEIETPEWLAAEVAEAETELEPDIEAEQAELAAAAEVEEEIVAATDDESDEVDWLDEETGLEWLDAVTSEQPSEGQEWLDAGSAEAVLEETGEVSEEPVLSALDEEIDDLMPDWLTMDEESWGEDETDIASWLVAEEELTQVSMETPPPPAPAPPEPEAEVAPEPEPAVVYQRMEAPEEMDATRLEEARSALDEGDMDVALGIYQQLLDAGAGLNVIIADLELAAEAGYKPALCRVLGDTYMQNGQLNRALEVYRKALDML